MTEAPAPEEAFDIAILGGGPVGLALACALAETRWRIALIERRPRNAPDASADPRALAIAHGGRQTLERLNAWDGGAATAIREIHVSQRGGFGRTLIRAEDENLPALGYVMPYCALTGALERALTAARERAHDGAAPAGSAVQGIERFDACAVERIDEESAHGAYGGLRLTLTQDGGRRTPHRLRARLVVHAEGAPTDATGDGKTPGVFTHDYRQRAIVARIRPARNHNGRAWERFTPEGPVALLPLGEACALIMAAPPAQADALLQLEDEAFLAALRARFGARPDWLDFVSVGPRAAFPLALRFRTSPVAARQVWIGNSAQTLHPVSGQGFNLGLRDAWTLAETLMDARSHALPRADEDPGCADTLAAYARRRRLDRLASAAFTDGIVRAFSNDLPPLHALRGLGLLALDAAPPLRHALARRMIWGARVWP